MPNPPKASVYLITYNQAEFVGKALDSILMQKVSFDYEIVVGDDGSTDGTVDVIKEYQASHPDRIKPIFRPKNIGMARNARETFEKCAGEYIACLEGDDYWTDPDKFQLQVDYLDRHRDCALCHHKVDHINWPGGATLREYPPAAYRVERPEPRALAMFNYIQTCSLVFRREWMPRLDEQFEELKLGDWPLCVLLSQRGWIGYIDRTMAHYRVHASNSWNNRPADYKIRAMEKMAWYLLARVDAASRELWKDTLLALAFKEVMLAARSFAVGTAIGKIKTFAGRSLEFRKPFWVFNRLWPYYKANYLA